MTDNKTFQTSEDIKTLINKEDNEFREYNICCSKSSVGAIHFFSQLTICIFVLLFSFLQIFINPEKDNSIYFSLISSILSLFIQPPAITTQQIK